MARVLLSVVESRVSPPYPTAVARRVSQVNTFLESLLSAPKSLGTVGAYHISNRCHLYAGLMVSMRQSEILADEYVLA